MDVTVCINRMALRNTIYAINYRGVFGPQVTNAGIKESDGGIKG